MQGPTCGLSQQAAEAGGSLTLEARGRAGAASTTPWRAGTARPLGCGKRDGEVYECRNPWWWNPLKVSQSPGAGWRARRAVAVALSTTIAGTELVIARNPDPDARLGSEQDRGTVGLSVRTTPRRLTLRG